MTTEAGSGTSTPPSHAVSPSILTPAFVIQSYPDEEWEKFVLEYLSTNIPPYAFIEPKGGAGDKGRDIVAYVDMPPAVGPIDIFQCKAYDHKLQPGDVWTELGKLCVYTFRGDYPKPRRYRFASPLGVGTKLGDLLKRPELLRAELIKNWAGHCEKSISKPECFRLVGKLKAYVETFDFGVVSYIPVHELLEQHRRTPNWHQRFKRDYPTRPPGAQPPLELQQEELAYVGHLCSAYSDHLKRPIATVTDLGPTPHILQHFNRCRTDFFMADGLNRFYRDQFPGGAFEHVKKQVRDGVIEVTLARYPDGFARVQATVQHSTQLTLAQTEYTPYVEPGDKKGICHHLASDGELKWVIP